MKTVRGAMLVAGLSLVGSAWLVADPAPAPAGGTVKGKITWSGPAEKKPAKKVTADAEACGHTEVADESLEVGEGGALKNAVVMINGVAGDFKPADGEMAMFDQKGGVFSHHVLAVMKGAKVSLKNSDTVAHNVNISAKKNPAINETIAGGSAKEVSFSESEKIPVACNIHPWMTAWIVVHDNPFLAVTDAKGEFSIAGVPAGEYEARIWHELGKLGKATVKVADGGEATVTVAVEPK